MGASHDGFAWLEGVLVCLGRLKQSWIVIIYDGCIMHRDRSLLWVKADANRGYTTDEHVLNQSFSITLFP